MYALVDGQQLVLGPIPFNYRMINSALEEELEVDYLVNSDSWQSVPLSITDAIKILPAKFENPDYDPRFEYLTNITYEILDDQVIFTHDKGVKHLDQIKDEYKSFVKPERQEKENTFIKVMIRDVEVEVSTSRESRLQIASKLLGTSGPCDYKFNNDIWLSVDKADLEMILSKIDAKVQEAFDWELAKNQEIDSCLTGDEVYQVEITKTSTEPQAFLN